MDSIVTLLRASTKAASTTPVILGDMTLAYDTTLWGHDAGYDTTLWVRRRLGYVEAVLGGSSETYDNVLQTRLEFSFPETFLKTAMRRQ